MPRGRASTRPHPSHGRSPLCRRQRQPPPRRRSRRASGRHRGGCGRWGRPPVRLRAIGPFPARWSVRRSKGLFRGAALPDRCLPRRRHGARACSIRPQPEGRQRGRPDPWQGSGRRGMVESARRPAGGAGGRPHFLRPFVRALGRRGRLRLFLPIGRPPPGMLPSLRKR